MKIVAMVGSIRTESYNMKLTNFMKNRYSDKIEIEVLPIDGLPFYNEDQTDIPEIVTEMHEKIKRSDGILFATPEYNGSMPGILKNAIDWASLDEKTLVNKPAMIIGASKTELGTVKAQLHLRQVLSTLGVATLTLPNNEVYVGQVHQKMDENGNLTDEENIQFIDEVVTNFIDFVEKTVNYETVY